MNCYLHSNTTTMVSCGRCEKHICPQCMVSTSAGMRCPECAYVSGFLATAAAKKDGSIGMSALAGLLTGLTGAYVIALISFIYPLLTLLVAPLYGRLVADAVTSFHEDMPKQTGIAIGVASIMIGSIIVFGNIRPAHGVDASMTQAMVGLAIGLSAAICYFKLKRPAK